MMIKNMRKSALALCFASSVSAFSASASITATPSYMHIGDITVLDWSQLKPANYPNPTFNLFVTKPNGEPRFAFRRGYKEVRFARKISMSGSHLYEVEICDSKGNNCMRPTNAQVVVRVDHGCDYIDSGYSCNGNRVTQRAENGQFVSDFQVILNRATWKFTDRNNQTEAYYTACTNGSNFSRITQFQNLSYMGPVSKILNFVSARSGYAKWTHVSDYGVKDYSTYIGHC